MMPVPKREPSPTAMVLRRGAGPHATRVYSDAVDCVRSAMPIPMAPREIVRCCPLACLSGVLIELNQQVREAHIRFYGTIWLE